MLAQRPVCIEDYPGECALEDVLKGIALSWVALSYLITLEYVRRALGKLDERSRNHLFYFCACIFLCGFAFIVFDDAGYGLERPANFMVWPVWSVLFIGSGVIVILDVLKGKEGEEDGDGKGVSDNIPFS